MITANYILKENHKMCPFLQEIQREAKRNAQIKSDCRQMRYDTASDISEETIPVITKVKAHLKRRAASKTKNRWIELTARYANEIVFSEEAERTEIRRYLQAAKDALNTEQKRIDQQCRIRNKRLKFAE